MYIVLLFNIKLHIITRMYSYCGDGSPIASRSGQESGRSTGYHSSGTSPQIQPAAPGFPVCKADALKECNAWTFLYNMLFLSFCRRDNRIQRCFRNKMYRNPYFWFSLTVAKNEICLFILRAMICSMINTNLKWQLFLLVTRWNRIMTKQRTFQDRVGWFFFFTFDNFLFSNGTVCAPSMTLKLHYKIYYTPRSNQYPLKNDDLWVNHLFGSYKLNCLFHHNKFIKTLKCFKHFLLNEWFHDPPTKMVAILVTVNKRSGHSLVVQ